VLALLVACSSGTPTGGKTPTPTPRPSSPAILQIVSPVNGSTVKGPTIHVKLTLANATIVPLTTRQITPTTGHVHIKLDGQLVTMTAGLTTDVPNVTPGAHEIQAEFVAADHIPFDPRVFTGVTFNVT
jgi:hypothetical protein